MMHHMVWNGYINNNIGHARTRRRKKALLIRSSSYVIFIIILLLSLNNTRRRNKEQGGLVVFLCRCESYLFMPPHCHYYCIHYITIK